MSTIRRPSVSAERVRWADVDLVGIMRFSAVTRLVENGEQDLWREAGLPYSNVMEGPDTWMPRRSLNIEYTAPARIDDPLALVTYVSRMGDTSLTFNVEVMSADFQKLYASAKVVTVCVDSRDFRKQTIPEALRTAMAPFVMSPDEVRSLVSSGQLAKGQEQS